MHAQQPIWEIRGGAHNVRRTPSAQKYLLLGNMWHKRGKILWMEMRYTTLKGHKLHMCRRTANVYIACIVNSTMSPDNAEMWR